jgi:hypothetical protein
LAQQVASLTDCGKPYTIASFHNSFVYGRFPNFDINRHRDAYPELRPRSFKNWAEAVLLAGPIQVLERVSRAVLGPYLKKKVGEGSDVQLDPRRMKLHLRSHKFEILNAERPHESVHSTHE